MNILKSNNPLWTEVANITHFTFGLAWFILVAVQRISVCFVSATTTSGTSQAFDTITTFARFTVLALALCEDEVDEDDDVDQTNKSHIDKQKFRNGRTDTESTAWLLAIFLALRRFRHFFDGCNMVTIKNDHKPIIHALSKTSDAWTGRQQRQISAIAETGCTVHHLPGKLNPVVDAL